MMEWELESTPNPPHLQVIPVSSVLNWRASYDSETVALESMPVLKFSSIHLSDFTIDFYTHIKLG